MSGTIPVEQYSATADRSRRKVEFNYSGGERLSVQTTRDDAELNEFAPGQIVYVKPTRHTTFT